MIRICSHCKKDMGNKCPVCGAKAETVVVFSGPEVIGVFSGTVHQPGFDDVVLLRCAGDNPRCGGKIFERGMGGTTHGVCSSCHPKVVKEEAQTETLGGEN
ncbi:MAG: hypothetical protein LAP21_18755 [Acidobacteriia bacterium]|nr:hypothetical protein [Terriglobia bacterium]